ncbi:hypothetical protein KQI89_15350 [Clostridium sp. MSJ-4]|uniref:Group-specific protein n=1 Tax=Clostridium simiarum TaxID=2841506 RepID=A0ABS6F5J1_9CLOT|nr:hypothetical protein [Clostridium simiarum]MBU5593124.1 hypothetical protein [Clostridium simiarum]
MFKKIAIVLFSLLLFSMKVSAAESIHVEIFHINQESVVKRTPLTSKIQREAENYIKGITGVYAKFNPIPNSGYMIKIPFETPAMIKNQWINAFVDEIIVIFPEQEDPYLLVFDNKDRTIFLSFKGNTDLLLKHLKFKLNTS